MINFSNKRGSTQRTSTQPVRRRYSIIVYIQHIYFTVFIEYDPAKAAANLRKHGISLADGRDALLDPLALTVEDLDSAGERRFVTLGMGAGGELLSVVFVERGGGYRLISARRATRKERNDYEG